MAKKIADPKDVTVEYREPPIEKYVGKTFRKKKPITWVSRLKKDIDAELKRTRLKRNKAIYKIFHDAGISDEEIATIKGP